MSDSSKSPISRCIHGLFFIFIGIAALFAGSVHNQEAAEFKERGISTEAIVVRIEIKTGGSPRGSRSLSHTYSTTTFRPIVRFTDTKGLSREGFSLETKAEYEKLPIGSTVTITYLPEAPDEVLLEEDTLETSPFIWIPIGGAIILFGCWYVYRAFPGKKKN